MKKRVLEILRVSTSVQAAEDRAGLPSQRTANRRTAEQYGLEIVKTLELVDVSGAAILAAPEMQELLDLIQSPHIEGVVAREFSRLMRPENYADFAILQAFAESHTVLYLPDGPLDFTSKSGRLLGPLRAALAGLERTEILERMWSAKEEKRKQGGHPQSRICLPFGVGHIPERGWYYKAEAEKVREAFRLFLSGETSYWEVGRKVGIEPFNLRIILRNPVYTGWRIYDKRRDPSPGARRTKADGRQADRKKILRKPEEVIRVKVLEALVSEEDFQRVQTLLNLKREKHWRAQPGYRHKFTYNGFLVCGGCRNLIYTHVRRPNSWYVCKSRTTAGRKTRENAGLERCENGYMRREKLESCIDTLLSERLMERDFLQQIVEQYAARLESPQEKSQILRTQRQLEDLKQKRQRILDAYFEAIITRDEMNRRLKQIDKDEAFYQDLLLRAEPVLPRLSVKDLARAFSSFFEWEFLSREQKRRLLQATVPEIHVLNYQINGLSLLTDTVYRNEVTRKGTGSSPWPA